MESGKIVVCYHGVGKTTCAKRNKGVVELTESPFSPCGGNLHGVMAKVAVSLMRQGMIVLLPYSAGLMDWLDENGTGYTAVYPSPELKDEWLAMLGGKHGDADYTADIARMSEAPVRNVIEDMDYELLDIVVYGVGNIRKDVFGMFDNMIFSSGGGIV